MIDQGQGHALPPVCEVAIGSPGGRWMVRWSPGRQADALNQVMAWAQDPGTPFTWMEALIMAHQIGVAQHLPGKTLATGLEPCKQPATYLPENRFDGRLGCDL